MRLLAIDLETHLFGPGDRAPRIVCAGVMADDWDAPRGYSADELRPHIETWLRDTSIRIVNQTPSYDMACIIQMWPELSQLVWAAYDDDRIGCTMQAAKLLDLATLGTTKGGRFARRNGRWGYADRDDDDAILVTGYSLHKLAIRYLHHELDKGADSWRTRYADLDGLPFDAYPDDAKKYVLEDAVAALGVWRAVHAQAAEWDVPIVDVYRQTRSQWALHLATCAGIYTDPVYIDMLRRHVDHVRASIKQPLLDAGLLRYAQGNIILEYHIRLTRPRDALQGYTAARGVTARSASWANAPAHVERILRASRQDPDSVSWPMRKALERLGLWRFDVVGRRTGRRFATTDIIACADVARARAERIEIDKGLRLPRTDKGAIQVNPAAAAMLQDDLITAYVEWSQSSSVMAEIDRLSQGVTAPLHAEYRTLMDTGRTSSGGGQSGINIQNRRREYGYRECFVPRDGHVLVSIDYDQIELCALGHVQRKLLGSSALADAIDAGKDVHCVTAASIMDRDYESVVAAKKTAEVKEMRTLSKALNFGLPGGLGEVNFIEFAAATYGVTIPSSRWAIASSPPDGYIAIDDRHIPRSIYLTSLPPDVIDMLRSNAVYYDSRGQSRDTIWRDHDGAERVSTWRLLDVVTADDPTSRLWVATGTYAALRAQWLTAYPEMLPYLEMAATIAGGDGVVNQLYSDRRRANCRYTQAANSPFQGLVADGALSACYDAQRACWHDRDMDGSRLLLFVHDEFVFEIPESRLHIAAYKARDIVLDAMRKWIPDVRLSAEPAAMRRWTKAAETCIVDGRLVPYEDWLLSSGECSDEMRADLVSFMARRKKKNKLMSI